MREIFSRPPNGQAQYSQVYDAADLPLDSWSDCIMDSLQCLRAGFSVWHSSTLVIHTTKVLKLWRCLVSYRYLQHRHGRRSGVSICSRPG